MSKVAGILEKSIDLLNEKKYYEYEQKLKTLSSRYYSTGKFDEASHLLIGGAESLINNQQIMSGYGLLLLALDTLKKNSKELTSDIREKVITVLKKAPYEKAKVDVANKVLVWFSPNEPDQDILTLMSQETYKNSDYHLTQRFLLRCNNSNELAIKTLDEWMELGNNDEKDLFVVRYVLMKLAVERVKDAQQIMDYYNDKINTPLMHFTSKDN